MDNVLSYITVFFMVFFSCAAAGFCLRFAFLFYTEYWLHVQNTQRELERNTRDRQGNDFTQNGETVRDSRYNDIFFIQPNNQEAAHIRAQLEKDNKDLPSYEEVMRIGNFSTTTVTPAVTSMPSVLSLGTSSSSVNTVDTTLTLPSYTEMESSESPLTPPPYSTESAIVLPLTVRLQSQQNTQST